MNVTCAILARSFALAVLIADAGTVTADVFKCSGERGTPIYQEMPCPPGKELRNFQVDPPEITVLPAPVPGGPAATRPGNSPSRQGAVVKESKAPKPATQEGTAAERKHIRSGMSEADVLARLGQPDVTSGGKNRKSARWTYLPAPGDPDTITSLTFANGVVTDVDRKLYRK